MKKILKFISSMRFAIALLVLLAAACALSSLVTQNQTYAWYAERYSERTAAAILALGLDDAFHSWWFLAITGFLCLNLTLCNLVRLPALIKRTKAQGDPAAALRLSGDVSAEGVTDPAAAFARLRMPKPVPCKTGDGREALFSDRHRIGLWGAWVCHLGILLLILGFALGQMTQRQYAVYGVPGQSRTIGDSGYALSIDDFRAETYADGSPAQYETDFTVYNLAGGDDASRQATVSVNNPASVYGMKFYQNATGWAATVSVTEDGQPLQSQPLCVGEYLTVQDKEDLVVLFNAFYPDYVLQPGAGPSSASNELNNPAYLYSVYYREQLIGMNALMAGETLTIDAYEVTFSDPRSYTLLQVKADRFAWLALAGGIVTMAGLLLAFYLQPSRVWAVREAEGTWTLYGQSPKGGALFKERFDKAIGRETQDAER